MAKMVLGNLFGRTILIVASDAPTREMLAGAFQSFRCNVLLGSDSSHALKLIETNPQIEIVILEIASPISNGFSFVDSVRALDADGPPVFFVADKKDDDFEKAFFHGVEAIFLKPILFDELVKGVAFSYGMLMDRSDRMHSRRRMRRAKVQYSVEGDELNSSGYVTNISLGGMFVSSVAKLPAATQNIQFRIFYDSETPVEINGRAIVRWLRPKSEYGRPPGFGVEFVDLEPHCVESIRTLSNQPT